MFTVIHFGDGSTNQGTFHESLNLAAVWKLPVIFVCSNNKYGGTTDYHLTTSIEKLSLRAKSYGIPGITIDGNDVLKVYDTVSKAMVYAKAGKGPTLIEAITYRQMGHTQGEEAWGVIYRTDEEIKAWKKKDPITRFEKKLLAEGVLNKETVHKIQEEIKQELDEAVKFARESPPPSIEMARTTLFAD